MANSTMTYQEIRFIIDEELTHVYVLIKAGGDSPITVQGWHHKAYPPTKDCLDILTNDVKDSVLWPLKAPTTP